VDLAFANNEPPEFAAKGIETLARAGVKASASLFDASLLSDAHALIS
jgi:hypothetical protein